MAAVEATTVDAFLGGRLTIRQPARGYRASTDAVFLAAAVPARSGDSVLDLGAGTGVVSLCLGWRVPGLDLHALELQPEYAALARENAERNGISLSVVSGDVGAMPRSLTRRVFDHVITNPPYFLAGSTPPPGNAGKRTALAESVALEDWLAAGLRRLRPGGILTLIHRAERFGALVATLGGRAGGARAGSLSLLPVCPRANRPAGRFLLACRKGSKSPDRLLPPLVVHLGDRHERDGDSHTPEARRVLRDGEALDL
ncbi:MAG: methyltransferase [Paracoccaceae bacterium]|nr:methyltransferase [Paracoccaceae bacterium]